MQVFCNIEVSVLFSVSEIFVFKLFNFAIKSNANLPNSHMKLYCRVKKNGSCQEG